MFEMSKLLKMDLKTNLNARNAFRREGKRVMLHLAQELDLAAGHFSVMSTRGKVSLQTPGFCVHLAPVNQNDYRITVSDATGTSDEMDVDSLYDGRALRHCQRVMNTVKTGS